MIWRMVRGGWMTVGVVSVAYGVDEGTWLPVIFGAVALGFYNAMVGDRK